MRVRAIAWLDGPDGGRWARPEALGVPLDDRGLRLADGIFETVLVEAGRPRLLAEHLQRWRSSADLLGMEAPPGDVQLNGLIAMAIERVGLEARSCQGQHCGALRLNWSRGSMAPGCHGIDLPPPGIPQPPHHFWLELRPAVPSFAPVRVIVSRTERRLAGSLLSRCKTFAYGAAIQARREARAAGADDALLESTAGGLCCGTTANLLVRQGAGWLTPPLASGCLPGVMRGRALELRLAQESPISRDDLAASSGAVLLNSLGCRPISHLAGQPLRWVNDLEPSGGGLAERLWRRLLGA
ncbi:MAG: aminotransferase class IV [Synechococcaceae cyanobacterium]